MSRAFDLAPLAFANLMKDIRKGQRSGIMNLGAWQSSIDDLRALFLSRRPQIMITNNIDKMYTVYIYTYIYIRFILNVSVIYNDNFYCFLFPEGCRS